MELAQETGNALREARSRAIRRRNFYCEPVHVLEVLLELDGDSNALEPLRAYLDGLPTAPFRMPSVEYSESLVGRAIPRARKIAKERAANVAEVSDLRDALLGPHSPIPGILRDAIVARLRPRLDDASSPLDAELVTQSSPEVAAPRATANSASPTAPATEENAFLIPVLATEGWDHLVDRQAVTDRVLVALMHGSPLVVGPVGSGRLSILQLAMRRIMTGDCPSALSGLRVLQLDPVALLAGAAYQGELEARMQKLVERLTSGGGRELLLIEDCDRLVGGTESGRTTDLSTVLIPHLRSGRIRLLARTSHDLLRERLERHKALLDHLTIVTVPEPDEDAATELLAGLRTRLEQSMDVRLAPHAIRRAVELSRQFLPTEALPGAPERLTRSAAATLAFELAMRERDPKRAGSRYWQLIGEPAEGMPQELGERNLLVALSDAHGIPMEHLERGVDEKIEGLQHAFRARIFGQDQVLPPLIATVKVALKDLGDERRPRGAFLFLGPPGTGKTECALLVAQYLMGSESALQRFNMSEYQDSASVAALIGAAPGLVGYEEGGRLTEPVRQDPHRVMLFDEIEKAHPKILDLFLQILDCGEIRDRRGRTVSFRHTLCIFTSNAGCHPTRGLPGETREEILDAIRGYFRAEFLDRFKYLVPFRPLSSEARRQIVAYQLERCRKRVERKQQVKLTWDPAVAELGTEVARGQPGARRIEGWVQLQVLPAVVDAIRELEKLATPTSRTVRLHVSPAGDLRATPDPEDSVSADRSPEHHETASSGSSEFPMAAGRGSQ